ncbi:MAG: hypothetical protein HY825_19100 [Acidobacteria bacterium]|nr:hypothetical protein [Acidobacteriota bacterium]
MVTLPRTHPFVLAEVERALGRLPRGLPEETREAMREVLLDTFTEDPVFVELLRALMPVAVHAESDEREIGGGAPAGELGDAAGHGGGGGRAG